MGSRLQKERFLVQQGQAEQIRRWGSGHRLTGSRSASQGHSGEPRNCGRVFLPERMRSERRSVVGARGAESPHGRREAGESSPEAGSQQTDSFISVATAASMAKTAHPVKGRSRP